ncbi:MAG: ABC transporter ATP-binding protein [Brumimicrobium sp.]|nr:ABC transporter ATP-binding protein [Brumimicrobium sp.]MCO5269124.1 ABC transporter ATP-binding protein [Brumimicrobium sp.]
MLHFQNLHIGFQGKQEPKLLFEARNLEFLKGELVGLIGPNGSGKTTLFDHLMGFITPIEGEICVHNKSLFQLTQEEKVKTLSYVPSKFFGVNHLSVYELISMGRAPYTNILNRLSEEDKRVIDEVLNSLDLMELQEKDTIFLSDGERQIAMIGKALAQESEVMVLDEPTAFLDYNNKRKVMGILQNVALHNEKLVFISSHDLELCFEYCTKIIAIDKNNRQLVEFTAPFQKEEIISKIFS